MGRKSKLSLISEGDYYNKLSTSIHWDYVINAVNNGTPIKTLWRILNEEKHYKVSLPTVRDAVKYIRSNNGNVLKLIEKNRKAALDITEDIKNKVPALSNTLKRRAHLISELMERKKEVLFAQKEGERIKKLKELIYELRCRLACQETDKIEICINNIEAYITANFTQHKLQPHLEHIIKDYIMSIHEVFKYAEQWTSKYDIYNLMEKLSYELSSSAIKVFGSYIKDLSEEEREKIISNFGKEVKRIFKQVETEELKIEDDEEYDEKKYN